MSASEKNMTWKECVENKIIRRITPNQERTEELRRIAQLRLEFWQQNIDEKFSVLKIEAYYDIIKELILADMHKEGYTCMNHLCLLAYLEKKFEDFSFEIHKIDELRKARNEISYRGTTISKDYLLINELEFQHIIDTLL